jgi:CheY-like chemotaxis protein
MESVGLLAGGVAHDFNNLLTVVLGNVELLLENSHLQERERNALTEIYSAAKRGALMVSQLLAFSRRQMMVARVLDLNTVVREVQTLVTRLIREHIEVHLALHAQPLFVKADATQLQQVIMNLATNARDAMPSGGRLVIETDLHQETAGEPALPPGQYAVLSVRDTGIGMDAHTKRMAFHPFFTTKELGRGTGLGLATVHGIVEQSAGRIFVESEAGKGACFRILLPCVLADAEVVMEPSAAAVTPPADAATIVIVEDEGAVRELTAEALRAARFKVIEAENGERALDVLRQHEGTIDLLISDVVMPRLGGLDLAELLLQERPSLRILLVSGYSPEQLPSTDGAAVIQFLQKPYTRSELLDKVSKVLAAPPPSTRPSAKPEL